MNAKDPTGLAVSFFKQQLDQKLLDLTPRYQRNVVWPASSQAYLIDTMLKGLPIPPVFMEARTSPEGVTRYAVVDGKQRLESIFRFINGELVLPAKMSPTGRDARFRDLPEDARTALFSYKLSAIELQSATSEAIRDMFKRLNRNVAKLTSQELRHALYFDKPIYTVLEKLARNAFWDRHSFFPRATANRMGDVEYISQLVFAIAWVGPLAGEKGAIDNQYRDFDQQERDLRDIERKFNRTLKRIVELLPDLRATRFKQTADFYGLFVALVELEQEYALVDTAKAGQLLQEFSHAVDQFAAGNPAENDDIRNYHNSVVEGASKLGKRRDRVDIIQKALMSQLKAKDRRRSYTETEKRIIWSQDKKRVCHICGRTVRSFDEYEPDHLEPHSRGGATRIANAKIAHRSCNRQRGSRSTTATSATP